MWLCEYAVLFCSKFKRPFTPILPRIAGLKFPFQLNFFKSGKRMPSSRTVDKEKSNAVVDFGQSGVRNSITQNKVLLQKPVTGLLKDSENKSYCEMVWLFRSSLVIWVNVCLLQVASRILETWIEHDFRKIQTSHPSKSAKKKIMKLLFLLQNAPLRRCGDPGW